VANFIKIGQTVFEILLFFWISEILNFYWLLGSEGPRLSLCQISSKSVNLLQSYCDFSIFSRWLPPPSWISEILNFYWLRGSNGPRCITLPNFINTGQSIRDIAISLFLKMVATAVLDFKNSQILLVTRAEELRCITVRNFVEIYQSVAELLRFFDFSRWLPPPS